ncbi:hypothetical protein [Lysobacter fragariae]
MGADLMGADLMGADLMGADLMSRDLMGGDEGVGHGTRPDVRWRSACTDLATFVVFLPRPSCSGNSPSHPSLAAGAMKIDETTFYVDQMPRNRCIAQSMRRYPPRPRAPSAADSQPPAVRASRPGLAGACIACETTVFTPPRPSSRSAQLQARQ